LFWASLITFLLTGLFAGGGAANFMAGRVTVFLLILALSSFILTMPPAGFGVLALQQVSILSELWIVRKELKQGPNHNAQ
jgi:hypothetical protein